jgi:osmoprotectant transport system permease protein
VNWALDNRDLLADSLRQHMLLSLPPIVLSLAITVPLTWLLQRHARITGPVVTASALLYTIPSLALFLVIPAVIGTELRSPINVIIALTLYGLALLVPAAVAAIRSPADPVVDAATSLGMSRSSLYWDVQLPLAGPEVLAALRVVSASTISLATLGAVLGIAGLGRLFTDGFQRGLEAEIVTGVVLTVALAALVDLSLVLLGRLVMPWTRRTRGARA